jgi:hypothetical protein
LLEILPLTWISLAMLLIPFLWGVLALNRQMPRMLIRNRKIWSLMYACFLLGLLIFCWGNTGGFGSLYLVVVPLAAFHSLAYEHAGRPWMARLLHLITIFAIACWNYLVLNK